MPKILNCRWTENKKRLEVQGFPWTQTLTLTTGPEWNETAHLHLRHRWSALHATRLLFKWWFLFPSNYFWKSLSAVSPPSLSHLSQTISRRLRFLEVLWCELLDWCLPQAGQTGVNVIFSSPFPSSNYVMPSGKVAYCPVLTLLHLSRHFCVEGA